jgi:DNA-binding PadR family transcriptional regulator
MRRKAGTLLPIEIALLQAALALLRGGAPKFHGYLIAKEIREQEAARRLTAHGTLYRALERLEKAGLLASRWEDPSLAASEDRPRRRLYHITAEGEAALQQAVQEAPASASELRRKLAPS